jgi:NitT/TauT family transport system ATP-binding protein
MGRSGIGKTSLLHAAAELLPVSAGRVAVQGRRAVVFQEPRLLPWRSALDNAALGLKALGVPRRQRRERAAALLHEFGLRGDDLQKRPNALSGGMRQRVSIARALAIEPAVLLLDEPFAALDAGLRAALQLQLREAVARRHLATLLVTHDVVEAVRVADRIMLLEGRPATLRPTLLRPRLPAAPAGGAVSDAAVFEVCAMLLRQPGVAPTLGLQAAETQQAASPAG